MIRLARSLNATMILVLVGVLIAAYYQQFTKHEVPCPLCILQRLAMISAALGCFMNLRYGIKPYHYTLTLVSAMVGGAVSLRQICLHICPGSPTFGMPVFGLSLYTWAFFTFVGVLFVTGLLLTLIRSEDRGEKMNGYELFASITLILITVSNLATCFLECQFGFCTG